MKRMKKSLIVLVISILVLSLAAPVCAKRHRYRHHRGEGVLIGLGAAIILNQIFNRYPQHHIMAPVPPINGHPYPSVYWKEYYEEKERVIREQQRAREDYWREKARQDARRW